MRKSRWRSEDTSKRKNSSILILTKLLPAGVGAEASPKDQRKGADVEMLAAQMKQIATSKVVICFTLANSRLRKIKAVFTTASVAAYFYRIGSSSL